MLMMTADITRLRLFLEAFPVPENDDKPLNPGGERDYLIILSHCHYGEYKAGGQHY